MDVTAIEMRQLRAITGLSRAMFSKIIGINPKTLEARERRRNTWPESEVGAAILALTKHGQMTISAAESVSQTLSPKPTPKIP